MASDSQEIAIYSQKIVNFIDTCNNHGLSIFVNFQLYIEVHFFLYTENAY